MKIKSTLKAGGITLYGTDWCGWTTKQKNYLNDKGMAFDYVNCDVQGACPESVRGFPTMDVNGTIYEGYKEI